MPKIHTLSSLIISKIAAGEVIERPAYAVKELLENAIDAGATSIRIDLTKSGLERIVITDNGEGMCKEDLVMAAKPHTTSKIKDDSDLVGIKSLGFRGEALSSIAAIGNVTIRSRTKQEPIGSEVQIIGGSISKISPVGMAVGTVVIVEDLFHSIPARKKFLKSLQTEYRIILEIITEYALSYPKLRFFITNNKKEVLNFSENQKMEQRIESILDEDIYKNIVPILGNDEHVKIVGYISKPETAQSTTSKQYLFVNGRTVKNRAISQSIKEAYGTLLPPNFYPVFIISLTLPYELVDVNVHPRKQEVSFQNEQFIKQFIRESVEKSLHKHDLTFQDKRWNKMYVPLLRKRSQLRDGGTSSYAADILKKEVIKKSSKNKQLTILGQLHNLYILVQTNAGMFIVDQHAAHERILYEKFEEAFIYKRNVDRYELANPIELQISVSDTEIFDEHSKIIRDLGFEYTKKAMKYTITKVPVLLKDRNIKVIMTEVLAALAQERSFSIDSHSKRMLTYLACKSAVKAGDALSKNQCEDIIKQLGKVKNPYTCPHGRPLKIEVQLDELHRSFKRK